jgi:hypothetical protein
MPVGPCRSRCGVVIAVVLASACVLAACSAPSANVENRARLSVLHALPAAEFVPRDSVLIAEHTYPLCSHDQMPSGSFERTFRVVGSVDRALSEATDVFLRAGWRVRARAGGSPARGVWLTHRIDRWTATVELLTTTFHRRTLTISFAAPSDKDC